MKRFLRNIHGSVFWQRVLAILMMLVITTTLLPVNTGIVRSEDSANTLLNGTNIDLTGLLLTAGYYDENNSYQEVNLALGDTTEFPYNSKIYMHLDFNMASDETIEVGKEYIYQLPSTIRVDENNVTHDLAYTTSQGTTSIGTVTISNTGTLTFVFNENIRNQTNLPFYVQFDGGLSDSLQEADKDAVISFPTASGQFDFNIRTNDESQKTEDAQPGKVGMNKSGYVTTIGGKKYIEWNINLQLKGRDSLSGDIIDNLPEGITYADVSGYPKISQSQASVTAECSDGDSAVKLKVTGATGSSVDIKFLTECEADAYGSPITNGNKEIKNTAAFNPDEPNPEGVSDTTSVWTGANMVEKSGSNVDANNEITWTVTLNKEQLDVGGATYKDTFGAGLEWADGRTVTVTDSAGNAVPGITVDTTSTTGFTLTFPSSPYTDTITLTYKTKVNDYSQSKFENTGRITGGTTIQYDYEGKASVPGVNLISKNAVGSYNSITREITWKITVNEAGKTLHGVTVRDNLVDAPSWQGVGSIKQLSYVRVDADSLPYLRHPTSAADISTADYLEFDFGDINEKKEITIVTKISDDYFNAYKGNATSIYNDATVSSTDITSDITDRGDTYVTITEPELINSKEGTMNGDGTIDWKVIVAPQQTIPSKYDFKDILPEKTRFVEGSMKLSLRYYDSNPLTIIPTTTVDASGIQTITYSLNPAAASATEKAKLEELFQDASGFEITYKTKVTDMIYASESHDYKNQVTMEATYGPTETVTDTATKTVTGVAGGALNKTYVYNSGKDVVTWKIAINEVQNDMSSITNPYITDQLPDYFTYLDDSAKLTRRKADGTEEEVTSGYQVTAINGNIVVQLPNIGSDTYYFEFRTRFNCRQEALVGKQVTNQVQFHGNGSVISKESNSVQNISFSSSSAGTYYRQEIRIKKVSTSNPNLVLSGATFQLKLGDVVVATATSGADGYAVFSDVDFSKDYTFQLVEMEAPDGYKLDTTVHEIKCSEITPVEASKVYRYYEMQIADEPLPNTNSADIYIKKVDTELTVIASPAEFGLYSDAACTTLLYSRTTNNTGMASFSTIAEGTYYIKEITSPEGYKRQVIPIKVVVQRNAGTGEMEVLYGTPGTTMPNNTYVMENEKAVGTYTITKVQDGAVGTKIPGVSFELYTDPYGKNRVQSVTTDANGIAAFTNLELGKTYYYREVSAPNTYILDTTMKSFKIGTGTEREDQSDTITITNTLAKGNIVITKVDDSIPANPLSGVTFTLYNADGTPYQIPDAGGTLVDYVVTTNAAGIARFEDLPFGTYFIKETTGLSGYQVAADTNVVVKQLGDTEVQIENKVIRFELQVTKTDNATPGNPLPDVEFELYSKSGMFIARGTTDSNGKLSFSGLRYGEYYLHESKTPAGYQASADVPITLTEVDAAVGVTGTGIVSKTIINDKQDGAILAKKQDENGNPLAGAVFALYDKNNKLITTVSSMTAADAAAYNAETAADATKHHGKTDFAEGDIWFEGLPYGTYTLSEIQAPAGYLPSVERYQITITADGIVTTGISSTSAAQTEIVIRNTQETPPYVSFKFKKVDAETPTVVLPYAEFGLYRNAEATPIATAVTDAAGIAYFQRINIQGDSDDTKYTVKEIQAPYGYVCSTQAIITFANKAALAAYPDGNSLGATYINKEDIPYYGTAGGAASTASTDASKATFTNARIYGSVTVTKYGVTKLHLLPGTEFGLYKEDGTLVKRAFTGADGTITFSKLPCGSYYVQELTPPKGFVLNNQKVQIEVTEARNYPVEYTDSRISLTISKQDIGANREIAGAELELYKVNGSGRTLIERWTSTGTPHTIDYRLLEINTNYVLVEKKAPAGYGYAAEIAIKIQADGSLLVNGSANTTGKTVVMKDTPIQLLIGKVASDNPTVQQPNAILALYNDENQELARFTTATTEKVVDASLLEAPQTAGTYRFYTLRELSAPDGYSIAEDVVFAIGQDGSIWSVTNGAVDTQITNATVTMTNKKKPDDSIYIDKVIAGSYEVLPGAVFVIKDGTTGMQIDLNGDGVVNEQDRIITGAAPYEIKVGTVLREGNDYVLEEIQAPTGYTIMQTPIWFQVKLNTGLRKYEIEVDSAYRNMLNTAKDTFMIQDDTLRLNIRKQDGFGMSLAGAKLQIIKKDTGTVVYTINSTDSSGSTSVDASVLEADVSYLLHEVTPPVGYTVAEDIEFFIHKDGTVERKDHQTVYNDTIVMQDAEVGVSIRKVAGGTTSTYLPGTVLQLTSEDDPLFITKTWTCEESQPTWELDITEFTVGCSYTLTEIKAPQGYAYAAPITFKLKNDRQLYIGSQKVSQRTIYMEDQPIQMLVDKQDSISKAGLAGAKLELRNMSGDVLYAFTSTGSPVVIPNSLLTAPVPGTYQKYQLVETQAPVGYEIALPVTVALDSDGMVYTVIQDADGNEQYNKTNAATVVMEDIPQYAVWKQDADGNLLAGAVLEITAKDDAGFQPITITSKTEAQYLASNTFVPGVTYVITEVSAPQGYAYAEPINFRIQSDGKLVVNGAVTKERKLIVTDKAITVKISKQDITNAKELPGAGLEIRDEAGNVMYSFISGTTPTQIPNTVFTAPKEGMQYYTLTEITAPDGYEVAETIAFAIDSSGQLYVKNADGVYVLLTTDTIVMQDKPLDDSSSDVDTSRIAKAPKTGDTAGVIGVSIMGLMAAVGFTILMLTKKKHR